MKAVDFLKRASSCNNLIDAYNLELSGIRSLSAKIENIKYNFVNEGNVEDDVKKLEGSIYSIIELEEMITNELVNYIKVKKEIYRVINMVEDSTEKALLIMRYVNFLKWETISYSMNYSEQHVYRLHKKALKSVDSILENLVS